jgi:hypothetical protein
MRKPYRIAIQAVLLALSLLVTWACIDGIQRILSSASANPGRPGYHVTAFVAYILWVALPFVLVVTFLRKPLGGLILLIAWLYLAVFVAFWEFVLPTLFVLLSDARGCALIVAPILGGILLSVCAIRSSRPLSRLSIRLRSYPGILASAILIISIASAFHWITAGEEMHVASAFFVADRHVARGDVSGGIRAYDSVLRRYRNAHPTTYRLHALLERSKLKHVLGDDIGSRQDSDRIERIVAEDEDLAEYLNWFLKERQSNKILEDTGTNAPDPQD